MRIQFKIMNRRLPEYGKVKKLYRAAFPLVERAPFFFLMAKSASPDADFLSMYADGSWVGFCYVINHNDLSYVLFLTISEKVRGRGYGSYMLRALKAKYRGQRIILAIEELDEHAANYSERVSRRHFYEKNGFKPQPCKIREASQIYDVMCCGGEVKPAEFKGMMNGFLGRFLGGITDMTYTVYFNK